MAWLWVALGAAVLLAACTSSPSANRTSSATSQPTGSASASSAPSPTLKPVPKTPVPAATPGSIESTVAARTIRTLKPVPLTAEARFDRSVTARVRAVSRVDATGRIPGEVSGPALSLTVAFTNTSKTSVATGNVVVNVADMHKTPLVLLETSSHRVRPTLGADATASGVYVFHLPAGFTNPVTVSVTYSAASPVVLFVGTA